VFRFRSGIDTNFSKRDLPIYANQQLGFGYSGNPWPLNKYTDSNYNHSIFYKEAYPNVKPDPKKDKMDEEGYALQLEKKNKVKSDEHIVEMRVPEWFCPVVCTGLNPDEIRPIKRVNPSMRIVRLDGRQFRFKQAPRKKIKEKNVIAFDDMEENKAMNVETTMHDEE